MLVGYFTFKELDRSDGKVKLVMFYVHRYIRLTIPLAFVIAFLIAFLPVIGQQMSSQFAYGTALSQSEYCRTHGWSILLYLNNFFEDGNVCIGVTWYTCDDMVFFWISLLVIYPMWSNPRGGALTWWFLWLVAATFPSVYQTLRFDIGTGGDTIPGADPTFFEGYGKLPGFYEAPWNRFQPYLIGILLGYILHYTRGKDIKISQKLNVLGWQVAFLSAFAVVYGINGQHKGRLSTLENTMYNGFQRIAWSLSLSWVIFSCSKGLVYKYNKFKISNQIKIKQSF